MPAIFPVHSSEDHSFGLCLPVFQGEFRIFFRVCIVYEKKREPETGKKKTALFFGVNCFLFAFMGFVFRYKLRKEMAAKRNAMVIFPSFAWFER
jgi:hypothetical protein